MSMISRLKLKDVIRVVLCTTFVAFPYLVLFQTHGVFKMISPESVAERWKQLVSGDDDWLGARGNASELPNLQGVLERAATEDKTVIVTTLNQAWAVENSMFDLFLSSFERGENISHLVHHLVVVTLDEVSHNRCVHVHEHCYRLKTEGVDFAQEKFFMSDDYLKMMWRRIEFLRGVLDLGYNFVFTDADVMWLRNPFPRFSKEADFQIACDRYTGNPTDVRNLPNGGFVYVRANERTREFYKYWHASRLKHPHKHDQDVFNFIKGDEKYQEIGIMVEFLDTLYFGGFCEVSQDLEKVCTMHANCCTGLQRKLADLRLVLEDWKRFTELTPLQRRMQRVYWKAPRECTHSFHR